jgi:hypothetical protein
MSLRPRVAVPLSCVLVATGAFSYFLTVQGLERADHWASIVAAFVAIAGLVVAIVGVARDRASTSGKKPEMEESGAGQRPAVTPSFSTIYGDIAWIQDSDVEETIEHRNDGTTRHRRVRRLESE